jgi:hypothetical protein
MKPVELEDLLRMRDKITADEGTIELCEAASIESDEIRELGRIVLEASDDEAVFFTTT